MQITIDMPDDIIAQSLNDTIELSLDIDREGETEMKLIINIDNKVYNNLKNRGLTGMLTAKECECMNEAIYNGTSLVEELEKIIEKINFEEKWLINIKTENGFIPMADICNAMYRIRRTISELKGEAE